MVKLLIRLNPYQWIVSLNVNMDIAMFSAFTRHSGFRITPVSSGFLISVHQYWARHAQIEVVDPVDAMNSVENG